MKLNYEGHLIITRTLQKGGMNDFIFFFAIQMQLQ